MDKERDSNREKLKTICEQVVKDPAFAPKDGKTFCNMATRLIARTMGCEVFPDGCLAAEMGQIMAVNPSFQSDTGARAVEHAQKGGLALAFHHYEPHSHVCAIYPAEMQYSPSWAKFTPIVANVGHINGVMKASEAFPVAQNEPIFYLWGEV